MGLDDTRRALMIKCVRLLKQIEIQYILHQNLLKFMVSLDIIVVHM